ncbi:MAG: collagen-like protein [Solirubrobacterales bacterium]|nr:collagen-like protein [Solirubrobacterales bacterium]
MKNRPATIMAILALFIAIGGTATAASGLINGSKIKPGTVAGKSFKSQGITKAKISTSALAALAGAQGPKGEKGARGDKGATGDQGPQGAPGARSYSIKATKLAQQANVTVTQAKLDDLPNGRYIISAKVNVVSQNAGSTVVCDLEANGGTPTDQAEWSNPGASNRGVLWMVNSTEGSVSEVNVDCNAGNSGATLVTTLTAIPTDS